MKTKITIIGSAVILSGFIAIASSIVRWFFLYPDTSQLILAVTLGTIITILGYIYNWMRNTEDKFKKIDDRLDSFATWFFKQEEEANLSIVKGQQDE